MYEEEFSPSWWLDKNTGHIALHLNSASVIYTLESITMYEYDLKLDYPEILTWEDEFYFLLLPSDDNGNDNE